MTVLKRPKGRLTLKVVEEALRKHAGIQSAAAEALGVHRSQISRLVTKNHKLQLVIAEVTDELNDVAESQLLLAIKRGEAWAVKFWLDNRGQERGFGQRKLAFKDGEGNVALPAMLVVDAKMAPDAWEAKFGAPAAPPSDPGA